MLRSPVRQSAAGVPAEPHPGCESSVNRSSRQRAGGRRLRPDRTPRLTFSKALAAACVLGVLLPVAVRAQVAQQQIHVSDLVTTPESVPTVVGFPGLSLELAFEVLNENSEPVLDAEVDSATLVLGADRYTPVVQKIETPWSIVILMDGSTTVANSRATAAYRTARSAIADSIDQAPSGSSFAVLQFANQAPTVLDFTLSTDKVKAAIRGLQAGPGTNSCLNNGLAEAINHLVGTSGRRVVILFTASADNCAQRQSSEVVALAQQNHVQIHAVGLRGYTITETDLSGLVDPTGGLASLREESDLVFGFNNTMAVLSNQWQARTIVYPAQGDSSSVLTVTLKDGSTLSSPPVTISSDQAFRRPPEIHLKGQVQPTRTGVAFNLDLLNPDLINQLSVSVISKKTGDAVFSQTFDSAQETNRIQIPGMAKGDGYQLVVTALDGQGRTLSGITADFTYDPPEAEIRINAVDLPTPERSTFVVTVDAAGLEGVASFKLWLAQGDNNTPVSQTTSSALPGEPLAIPADGVRSGEYQVVIQALDIDGAMLAQAASEKLTYHRPNPLDTLAVGGKDNPLVIGAVALVCAVSAVALVGLLILVLPKRGPKPVSVELALPGKMRRAAPAVEPAPVRQPAAPQRVAEPPPAKPAAPVAAPRPVAEPPLVRPATPAAAPPPVAGPPPPTPAAPARPLNLATPKARLVVSEPVLLRQVVEVTTYPFAMGRQAGNDWVLNVDNKWGVSGKHATITYTDMKFYIEDNQSSYGTLVNGKKVPPGVPTPLDSGAEIGLGPMVRVQFQLGDTPPRSSKKPTEGMAGTP